MNKSIKQIIILITAITLVLCLTACGNKTFKCGICNEEKTGKSYKSEQMGEEILICEECYEQIKEFQGK